MRKSLALSFMVVLLASGCSVVSTTPSVLPASLTPPAQLPVASQPSLAPTVRPTLPTLTPGPQSIPALSGHFVFIGSKHSDTELYMLDASCRGGSKDCFSQWVQLTDTPKASSIGVGELVDIFDLAVSPDGSKVAFSYLWPASDDSHDTDIAVLDLNYCRGLPGGCTEKDFQRLTTDPAPDQQPVWSPDGQYIDYVSVPPTGQVSPSSLFQMHADGSHQKLLLDSSALPGKAALFSPSWSPDGQKIAFNVMFLQVPHPDTVIYTADADGSNLRPLTIIAHNEAQPYQQDAGPVWSPNGRQILFWAYHGDSIGSAGISVISPLGGDAKIVTPNGDWSPQWSPDGNLVAYPSGGASGGLFVTGLDGSAPVQITTSRVDRVVWMP